MIQTLHQAHEEIKNYIDKKNYALAQDMLGQCQECVISIGTLIETLEGEGFITVSYAEAYCDVIFTTYEELNGNDVNANKVYKNLKKQLLRIENSVKNDVPVRKEIAFFPYKASMWDSLESVYLAAKKDPNCDVYCVPIPYYDKNPDRSFGQMHYEGREYPKNIEVIDWQTYNFEERKPDVIYIHNPYDDWNLVTSVHPRFYSFNLKKHTEELVYIPYFVLDEIEPNEQEKIDGMKHFCFLPGIINADKVIVQSENMRQIYINEYLKAAQVNNFQGDHVDRKKLEEKFLGLGSPKFDKILYTKKEDLEIPQEWLKIIEKADGSWKKIIFYNTSIAALLENNEKMLEKMKDVFRIFKENKDEVALLWRPHPLIKATVSSMRPKLWAEYEKLVDQYQQEGWGIYDNTADMDRAVVLSDAYYGDYSSIVHVYKKTGKKILLQNALIEETDEKYSLIPVNIVGNEEKCWVTTDYLDGIFEVDLDSGRSVQKKQSILELNTNGRKWAAMAKWGNKLILTPCISNNKIAVYDLEKDSYVTVIALERDDIYIDNLILYENVAYLFSCYSSAPMIIELNLNNYKIENTFYISINNETDKKGRIFAGDIVRVEDKIIIPLAISPTIVEFNIKTKEIVYYQVQCEMEGFATACYAEGYLWLSDKYGKVIRWNKSKTEEICDVREQIETFGIKTENLQQYYEKLNDIWGYAESYMYFNHSVSLDNAIVFFPGRANQIAVFDIKNNVWKSEGINLELESTYISNLYRYSYSKHTKNNQETLVYSLEKAKILKINNYLQNVKEIKIEVQDLKKIVSEKYDKKVHMENIGFPNRLEDLLMALT